MSESIGTIAQFYADLEFYGSDAVKEWKERRSATAVVWTELSPTHVTSSHGEIVCNPKGAWWITLAGHLTASCAFLNLSDAKAWVLANAVEVSA